MARHARLHVLSEVLTTGLVAAFHDDDVEVAEKIALALLDGGARAIEFLNRSDGALARFGELLQRVRARRPEAIVGIGSIVDPPSAALALNAGADFVVSPILHPFLARLCNRRKVALLPGCTTVTEISQAEALGAEIVKLFPSAALDGAEFIRSLHGPMPWSRVMPTGNAVDRTRESVERWIKAGACALGTGSHLVRTDDVAAGRFAEITARTKQMLAWIAGARAEASATARGSGS
jgi:2-dehydro-3-deoxyphosphogluconate aldolase/(4S)-4-hydroxy-2-oxoglutarate aldolase